MEGNHGIYNKQSHGCWSSAPLCAYVCMCVCSNQRRVLGVLLCPSPPHSLDTGSLMEPRIQLAASKPQQLLSTLHIVLKSQAPSGFRRHWGFELESSRLHRKCSYTGSHFSCPTAIFLRERKKVRLWKTAHGTFVFAHLHMCDIHRWCQEAHMARCSFCRGQLSSWGTGVGDFAIFILYLLGEFCISILCSKKKH